MTAHIQHTYLTSSDFNNAILEWRTGAWRRSYILPEHVATVPTRSSRTSTRTTRSSTTSNGVGGDEASGRASDSPAFMPAPPRFAVAEEQIAGLQRVLAKAHRSTLLLLDNQTPWSLRLASSHCDSGSFSGNGKPAPRIRPNELVMCGSISGWVGDAEGSVLYCIDDSTDAAAVSVEKVFVKWKNPMVDDLLSDRGKWSHANVEGNKLDLCWTLADGTRQSKSAGGPDAHPRPTQEPNNRLKVVITMRGQRSAPWNQPTAIEQTAAEKARANPRWIRSTESDVCMLCQRSFGRLTDLKHHCRRCGWAVCDKCSPKKLVLLRWLDDQKPHALKETKSTEALRVCLGCYDAELNPLSTVGPEPEPEPAK